MAGMSKELKGVVGEVNRFYKMSQGQTREQKLKFLAEIRVWLDQEEKAIQDGTHEAGKAW